MDEYLAEKKRVEPQTHICKRIEEIIFDALVVHGPCDFTTAHQVASSKSKMATGLVIAELLGNLGRSGEDAAADALQKLMSADIEEVCGDKDCVCEGTAFIPDEQE